MEEVSEGEASKEEASEEEVGEEEASEEEASKTEASRVEVSRVEVCGEESKRARTNTECTSGSVVETVEEINVVGSLGQNIDKWRKINTTEQVLAWIAHRLPLALLKEVVKDRQVYQFNNEQAAWLDTELGWLLQHNAIKCVGEGNVWPPEIRFVSPVFLVPKKGPKRWRLVINMHAINKALAEQHCKFKGLASLAHITGKNWWMVTFNLVQGYHHVEIEQEARALLGFQVSWWWFHYHVMPFRLWCSLWAFTKIVCCMLHEWRWNGVFMMAYLDDFMVLVPLWEEVLCIRDNVIEPLLRHLGWWCKPSKGCWEPTQEAEVLGLVVNLQVGQFHMLEGKMQHTKELCKANNQPTRTQQELAQVTGAVNTLQQAVPVVLIFLCRIYQLVGKDQHGWNRHVCLLGEARVDLWWLQANMWWQQGGLIWRLLMVLMVWTNALGYGWGGCLPECCQEARGSFSAKEMQWWIHHKEMWAVLGTVLAQWDCFVGQQVEFQSNNMMVVQYLHEGRGSDQWMTDIVQRVWQLLDAVGAKIYTAAWIRGATENRWADFLSRWKDPDNWQLSNLARQRILEAFGPWDVDRFMDDLSTTVLVFNSHFMMPGTAGMDVFMQDWSKGTSLLVPPIRLIRRVLAHAIKCGAQAILVAPAWPAHNWWPLLLWAKLLALPLGGLTKATVPSPSGRFKPGKNLSWEWQAFLINSKKAAGWRT